MTNGGELVKTFTMPAAAIPDIQAPGVTMVFTGDVHIHTGPPPEVESPRPTSWAGFLRRGSHRPKTRG